MSETKGFREPVPVRNKDIPLLSRVLYTMQDVSCTEQKRMWLQDRLWNMTQKLTGMPGGHGVPQGLDAPLADIGEIEEQYRAELPGLCMELKEAEDILNAIPVREMKTFVTMKYVLGMTRKEIMTRLNMRRRMYDGLCACIEEAQDMAHVEWPERYILRT
jgi:hypothetical protein